MNINLNLKCNRVKCKQRVVNFILTLMSPTIPLPCYLHPWPHHLPHAHYQSLPDFWKLRNWKRMQFEIIYFRTCHLERFLNSNCLPTETTKYFSTNFMHSFFYMVTNNLAYYEFLTSWNDGKYEGNKYLKFATFITVRHLHNETFQSVFNHKMWNA